MGVENLDELIGVSSKIEEKPIPDKDKICKCNHPLTRHRSYYSSKTMICIEQFCPCSSFVLARVL